VKAKLEKRIRALFEALEAAEGAAEDAVGMREALEAEAQEVAQRAVDAEQARAALEETLAAARERAAGIAREQEEAEALVEMLPVKLSKARALLAKKEDRARERGESGAPAGPGEGAGEGGESGADEVIPEVLRSEDWEPKTVEIDAVTSQIAECERQLSEALDRLEALGQSSAQAEAAINDTENKLDAAAAVAKKAEEMASAAMTATENAVRVEVAATTKVAELREDLAAARDALLKVTEERDLDDVVPADVVALAPAEDAAEARAEERPEEKAKAEDKAPAAPQRSSSKFMAASFFSSGRGDAEQEIANVINKFKEARGVLSAAMVAIVVASAIAYFGKEKYIMGMTTWLSAKAAVLGGYIAAIPSPHVESGARDVLTLLATSIITVPLMTMVPGGSAVLGFLLGGALIGPYSTGFVTNVHATKHIAELGVVFLLFHIGLELSLERLQSMGKLVFGFGSAQVVLSTAAIAAAMSVFSGGLIAGPASVVVGASLALSSTAVALQVLQDRGESGAKHGRATFSVLLLQDLAVVIVLMLIPLLAPQPDGSTASMMAIASAVGAAAVKAVVCIVAIIAGGRLFVRPLYRAIAGTGNSEIFAATTLLMCLGTAELTQMFGLSLALGAFLAGLLLAETEYSLQVESDIAPYRGLLLGLFFMTVGMEISPQLLVAKWATVALGVVALVAGKIAVIAGVAPLFGLSRLAAVRAGLFLGPGGEFAFVALGDAVARNILSQETCNLLFCITALSMAITPYLAILSGILAERFEKKSDTKSLAPAETETDDLTGHVIICGFGRIGQIIAQVLSERLIPFVALDVRVDRVSAGKLLDLPVYFGDAGSAAVLHAVGAERAACAVVALDSPGANYRTVYTLSKNFPQIKTYVRARDIEHGLVLEKAGASAVVPETLEPSLQLAANVLRELAMPAEEVAAVMDNFRRQHMEDLSASADPLIGKIISIAEESAGAPSPSPGVAAPAPAGAH